MKTMNDNKAFSLIELLAVIAIIGIVALITVPIGLNLFVVGKQTAAKDCAYGYIDAIDKELSLFENDKYDDRQYGYDEIPVNIKGTRPTAGVYLVKNSKIKNAVFCINGYKVYYENDIAEVDGNCSETNIRLNGLVTLSKSKENYTYPNSGIFEVTENLSGGKLSCISSDEDVAKCSIKDNIVTVTPGTKESRATITVIAAETLKYNEAQAVHIAITKKGILTSYTAYDYSGVYDGLEHSITLNTDLEVMYKTEEDEEYFNTKPTFTDVGTYTVYYLIEKEGYYTVTGHKNVIITQANGSVKLEKTSGTVAYDDELNVNVIENLGNGELTAVSSNNNIASAKIEDNKLVITGKSTGTVKITVTSDETRNYKKASTEFTVNVVKAKNKLEISSTNNKYTYPEKGTFEVTKNLSGGVLSCTTSDSNVATCSINGNMVTVTPGKKAGSATITIKAAETSNYEEGVVAHLAITEKGTLTSYAAYDYSGVYDGNEHSISVTCSDCDIKYGMTEGNYSLENPKFRNVGTYTVYYKISKEGYNDVTGSKTVTITKADGRVVAPTAKSLTYNESAQSLINAGSSDTGTIQYKVQYGDYSSNIPTATDDGTYRIYYRVLGDENHKDVAEASITVTIKKATLKYTAEGYSKAYDGESHGINVTSSGATIKYGTTVGTYNLDESPKYKDAGLYTVYYEITRKGYTKVTGSKNVEITKANSTLRIYPTNNTYTYPDSKTFEIVENTSGVTPTCTTTDSSIATCSISGNIVTLTPGKKAGSATINVKTVATSNYNATQAAHVAITEKGTLTSYSTNGYNGIYDGKAHGISVSGTGTTIKYGLSNSNYDLDESPTLTDVGEITVYYKISKEGYNDVEGYKKITISKADGSVTPPTAKTLTYNGTAQALINAGSSTTGAISYKLGSSGTYSANIPTATNAGTYTVYYKVVGDGNHKDVAERSLNVTIGKNSGSVTAPTVKNLSYTGSAQSLVNAGSSSTGTIQYKLGTTGTYSTSIPKATNVGTYTVYYKVVGDSNHNDVAEASLNVTIAKANNTLTLSASSGKYTYPNSGTFTITKNTSGGALSCTTSNSSVATCSISGTTVTVKPGTTEGTSTITIKSAATDYYNEGQAAYVATTAKGAIGNNYTANDYNNKYDGSAHGISVSTSISGATIKYGESNSSYNLTSSPTITNVGTKTVYFQISIPGYTTLSGSRTITITKADGNIKDPTAKSLTYNGTAQKLINPGSSTSGTVQYKLGPTGTYSSNIPKATNAGTYTVYYYVTESTNYNAVAEKSLNVTIGKKNDTITLTEKTYTYDGNGKTATVTATSGLTPSVTYYSDTNCTTTVSGNPINAGTYYAKASTAGNGNYNAANLACTRAVIINKANNELTVNPTSGTFTYPNGGIFTVTKNTSGSALSCTSNNTSVATCSMSGTTGTVTPGTTKGTATLTIKSAATSNYNEGQAAYVATTQEGTLANVNANGYTGTYDGKAHGITVSTSISGATIKYGTVSGTYNLTASPTRTDAGTTKVYYQISKAGYTTVTGNKDIIISKAVNKFVLSGRTLTYNGSGQDLATVTKPGQGNVCYSLTSQPTSCPTSQSIPQATNAGTYNVYYYIAGNGNYNEKKGYVTTTINKNGDVVKITSKTYTYDGGGKTATVTSSSGLTPSVTYYSNSACTTTVSGNPVNAGTYYAKASTAGNGNYNAASAGCTQAVVINKANNTLTLSANSGTYTYPNSGTFTITKNISGGAPSCSSKDTNIATCSISGTTVTVTPGTSQGPVTLTITSAATGNYNAGSASHVATTNAGTLNVTANDYNGTYDGKAHGITVSSSGATIKYGTASGTYNLTSSPTYTAAGSYTVYYQVSKAGYATVTGSKKINISANAPTITASDSKASNTWHNADYTLTFSSSGNASNIKYYIGTTTSPSTEVTSKVINSATNGTTYYVKACVGNSSTLCSGNSSYIAKLDKTPPKCSLKSATPIDWTNQSRIVTMNCSDIGGSGCASATYDQTFTSEAITVTTSKDMYDNAGNKSTCKVYATVNIDKTIPFVGVMKYGKPSGYTGSVTDVCAWDNSNSSIVQIWTGFVGNKTYFKYSDIPSSAWTAYGYADINDGLNVVTMCKGCGLSETYKEGNLRKTSVFKSGNQWCYRWVGAEKGTLWVRTYDKANNMNEAVYQLNY